MANTLKFGNGEWYGKKDTILAYNDENSNYKPLPFDFSRGSTPTGSKATTINKDGLIEEIGNNIPRIDYKDDSKGALLLEPARANFITYSEDIESWSISGTITKENNVAISPDGTLNAGTITTNDASGFHRITQTISVYSNSTYTASLFIKKVQSQTNYMGIGFIFTGGTTDVGYVIFDAVNGIAVSADARIDVISEVKDFGDYWRLQSTATDNGSNTSLQFNIYATLSTNGTTTGAGISSPRTIWGVQVEQGSYATSYIATSGSAVTRLADVCNNGANEQVINSTEGTLYVEANLIDGYDNNNFLATIFDNSNGANNNIFIQRYLGNIQAKIKVGTTQAEITEPNTTSGNKKIAFTYKENEFKMFVNGSQVGSTDPSGSVFSANTLDKINVGSYYNDTLNFNNTIKDLKYYNTALTDQELIALTQV